MKPAPITKGRPNGMPAFGGAACEPGIKVVGTVPDHQVGRMVEYVRSMSWLVPGDAAPGRTDHMKTKPPEHSLEAVNLMLAPPSDARDMSK